MTPKHDLAFPIANLISSAMGEFIGQLLLKDFPILSLKDWKLNSVLNLTCTEDEDLYLIHENREVDKSYSLSCTGSIETKLMEIDILNPRDALSMNDKRHIVDDCIWPAYVEIKKDILEIVNKDKGDNDSLIFLMPKQIEKMPLPEVQSHENGKTLICIKTEIFRKPKEPLGFVASGLIFHKWVKKEDLI